MGTAGPSRHPSADNIRPKASLVSDRRWSTTQRGPLEPPKPFYKTNPGNFTLWSLRFTTSLITPQDSEDDARAIRIVLSETWDQDSKLTPKVRIFNDLQELGQSRTSEVKDNQMLPKLRRFNDLRNPRHSRTSKVWTSRVSRDRRAGQTLWRASQGHSKVVGPKNTHEHFVHESIHNL